MATPPLTNPIWRRADNLRDPAVLPVEGGYWLYYSRFSNNDWSREENWAVGGVFTSDWHTFSGDHDLTPKGYASPGDPVRWGGRLILPYQSYPQGPNRLFYSSSTDGQRWDAPTEYLSEAADLPWNTQRRLIDPCLVVDGDTLHCFFVGSTALPDEAGHANLLGHAVTRDPDLGEWVILTVEAPLMGISELAPDGVENVSIFRTGDHWTMIFSECLVGQHLAWARSADLVQWERQGVIELPPQAWMAKAHGAPFVWRQGDLWRMILMGMDAAGRTTFGLLDSEDGVHWRPLEEEDHERGNKVGAKDFSPLR